MPSAKPPFGDEVINASLAVFIAGIPVLDCAVFHLASLLADDLYNGGMKLVLIAHRGCASLKIAHIGVIAGHNQRSLKLAGPEALMRKYVLSSIGHLTPLGIYTNEPPENTAEFNAAKKLSR